MSQIKVLKIIFKDWMLLFMSYSRKFQSVRDTGKGLVNGRAAECWHFAPCFGPLRKKVSSVVPHLVNSDLKLGWLFGSYMKPHSI